MDKELSWKYAEDFAVESDAILQARQQAQELGVEAVSPGVGAQLRLLAAATRAAVILEVGTGVGVSGLCLLEGSPDASFTSIDAEPDVQNAARAAFAPIIPAKRLRLITGDAAEVLPRMNDEAYDLVFIDADPGSVLGYVEHALRIAKPGGLVLVAHALWRDRVADPVQRDAVTADLRALLSAVGDAATPLAALSTAGDGLLQLVKSAG